LKCSIGRPGRAHVFESVAILMGLVFFLFPPLYASEKQHVISFFENDESLSVLQGAVYFLDETKNVTAEMLVEQRASFRWLDSAEQSLNLFYSDDILWLSFFVINTSLDMRMTLLEIDWPFIDNIALYRVDSGGLVVPQGMQGDHVLSHDRPLKNRAYIFPQNLEPQKQVEFLMKISTSSLILLPIELWDVDSYWENETATQTLLSLFFGLVLVMGIYNFGVWFYTRDVSYLYYSMFVAFVSLYEAAITGYGFQYLWQDSAWLNDHALVLFAGLSFLVGALFIDAFLGLKEANPTMHKMIVILVILYAAFIFFSLFVDEVYVAPLGQYMGLLLSVGTIALSAHEWRKGNMAARYFTIAWFVLLLGTSVYTLMLAGHIPHTMLTESVQRVGISLEVLLLSFALGDRFNRQRQMAKQATDISLHLATELNRSHEEKIRIQAQAQQELESKVEQRTAELIEAKKRLELLSITDQLTGLKNRRYFDGCYISEYKRAFRSQSPLSIMVIDIDHFKRVNDTYGHLVGDECIRRVAQAIHVHSQRPGDVAFRYGGEEFVVLLTDTDCDGSSSVAQLIRQEVERIQYRYDGSVVDLTVSIGIATEIPGDELGAKKLLQKSDDALYQAKGNGRNRVEVV
jgi:diguanylate cyclase (GGDEF)-like protein